MMKGEYELFIKATWNFLIKMEIWAGNSVCVRYRGAKKLFIMPLVYYCKHSISSYITIIFLTVYIDYFFPLCEGIIFISIFIIKQVYCSATSLICHYYYF